MAKYLLKRILAAIPTLLLTLTLIFFLIRAIPGNPIYSLAGAGEFISEEDLARLADQKGLAGTALDQYIIYMKNIFSGNWGNSLFMGTSVIDAIGSRIEVTLMLTLVSMLVTVIIGVPLGILAATKENSILDYCTSGLSILFMCIPNFVLGLLLIYIFGFKLQWFPISNYTYIADGGFFGAVYSVILPAFAIGMTNVAYTARYTRTAMLSVMKRDYIRTARAKGLSEKSVRYKHGLKNAFGTVLTTLSGALLGCLGGSVVVEGIFNFNGIGALASQALSRQDYPLAQADVIMIALMFIILNIFLDIGYKLLDPRITFD